MDFFVVSRIMLTDKLCSRPLIKHVIMVSVDCTV
jgi:hypothetical protein